MSYYALLCRFSRVLPTKQPEKVQKGGGGVIAGFYGNCLLKCRKLVVSSDCPWSPAIYERGHGLGLGYKWLACRVSLKSLYMAGLDSRVCMAGLGSRVCPGGTKCSAVDSLGDHNLGGWLGQTIDSMIGSALGIRTLCFLKFLLCYALFPSTKPIIPSFVQKLVPYDSFIS